MNKKYLIFIITLFLSCNSIHNKENLKVFAKESLYSKWQFIRAYEGTISNIDNLNKEINPINKYPSILTFKNDNTFNSFHGDYQYEGTFTFNEKTGIINSTNYIGKTKNEYIQRISYIDNEYLLLVIHDGVSTFLYKKINN